MKIRMRLQISAVVCTLIVSIFLVSSVRADELCVPTQRASTNPGKYCGGDAATPIGGPLDLNRSCKTAYGASATAVSVKPDALGWVCRVSGQPDHPVDVRRTCHEEYGGQAVAALSGLGMNDWRCIRPGDVNGKVVPILMVPSEKMSAGEAPGIGAAVSRVTTLMGGVRRFYRDQTQHGINGTNTFIVLTKTTGDEWQNLAIGTDHASGGFPLDRYGFVNRVRKELVDQGWDDLVHNSSIRLGGFAWLGSSAAASPTCYGASRLGPFFAEAPSVAYSTCSSGALNSPPYENAFYASAHEFGHTMGLPHTDQYGVALPPNWKQSVMYQGNGTDSLLFPFEQQKLLSFLNGW
jgi:hypothetical protein